MAHKVTLELPRKRQAISIDLPTTHTVLHKDIKFDVHSGSGKMGTLLVSKGNIEWLPAPKSIKKSRLTWKQFDELMQSQGSPARAAKKKS